MKRRTNRRYAVAAGSALIVCLVGAAALAQTPDPRVGTWKLNVAKSKYTAGAPPKSSTIKYEATPAGLKVTIDTVPAEGAPIHWEATTNNDGKDNPIMGNNPNGDTVARRQSKTRAKINASTIETTYKKAGKITLTTTSVISADGKTMTTTSRGTNAMGEKRASVAVYDKQ